MKRLQANQKTDQQQWMTPHQYVDPPYLWIKLFCISFAFHGGLFLLGWRLTQVLPVPSSFIPIELVGLPENALEDDFPQDSEPYSPRVGPIDDVDQQSSSSAIDSSSKNDGTKNDDTRNETAVNSPENKGQPDVSSPPLNPDEPTSDSISLNGNPSPLAQSGENPGGIFVRLNAVPSTTGNLSQMVDAIAQPITQSFQASLQPDQTSILTPKGTRCGIEATTWDFLGTSITRRIEIDATGKFFESGYERRPENSYERLAFCLIAGWHYEPAEWQGKAVSSGEQVISITIFEQP